ncbi:MAG: hypothetical protein HZA50_02380, partial [Planctomycetes bacterium]|nr:hypothetical protein [Planctomycetota bacterium]
MKQWPILSILMSSLVMLGPANSPAWSDEEGPGRGPRWAPNREEAVPQKAELEAALRQLREKSAQTEALIRQL